MKFIWYEDLRENLNSCIRSLSSWLGYDLSIEEVVRIEKFLEVNNYREHCQLGNKDMWNKGEGEFVRKGAVGGWKEYFDQETATDWNHWADQELEERKIEDEKFCKLVVQK